MQASWINGIAERSGGILKTIIGTLVAQHVVSGEDGMRDIVGFACAAYNEDVTAEGVSPFAVCDWSVVSHLVSEVVGLLGNICRSINSVTQSLS